jgi:hypothetical protein
MKENTKYHNYRFIGNIQVDEIQPWFDFTSLKPWDEGEIPWVLENRVRREILITLANGAKSFEELYETINFSPKPLLISEKEHNCNVQYQWTKETLENHLLNLEWYHLIIKNNERYELGLPILKLEDISEIETYIIKFSEAWIKTIKETKNQIQKHMDQNKKNYPLYQILVEKAVEKLYELLKNEEILPNEPNIKTLFAEQLRSIKFEEWVAKNF